MHRIHFWRQSTLAVHIVSAFCTEQTKTFLLIFAYLSLSPSCSFFLLNFWQWKSPKMCAAWHAEEFTKAICKCAWKHKKGCKINVLQRMENTQWIQTIVSFSYCSPLTSLLSVSNLLPAAFASPMTVSSQYEITKERERETQSEREGVFNCIRLLLCSTSFACLQT